VYRPEPPRILNAVIEKSKAFMYTAYILPVN